MIAIRRGGDALGTRKLHSLEGCGKRVFQHRALVRREFPQNVTDHFTRLAAADPDLETRKNVGVEVLEDGLDAVVTPGGPLLPETQGAERQGDIVIDHQHVLRGPLVKGKDLLQRSSTQVHERLRFKENRAVARNLRQVALPFRDRLENGARLRGKLVQQHEADVVAGIFVLAAGITEADDELEHDGSVEYRIPDVQPWIKRVETSDKRTAFLMSMP